MTAVVVIGMKAKDWERIQKRRQLAQKRAEHRALTQPRDSAIFEAIASGATFKSQAERFGLSTTRVRQIYVDEQLQRGIAPPPPKENVRTTWVYSDRRR